MRITRTRDVKLPERGTQYSAGIDFFVPYDFPKCYLGAGESVLIPSGIKADVPNGMALIAFNKSGVSVKKRLQVGACVVDEDYTGEIHIHVYNTHSHNVVEINPGDKIIQFVLVPVFYDEIFEVEEKYLFVNKRTERGAGGFGSTGER